MLTVKEFKEKGGVVVVGDKLHQNPTPVEEKWAEYINNTPDFDHYTFKSCAWRPIHTIPYDLKVECEFHNLGTALAHYWRPLLDQSALKPVNGAALKPSDVKMSDVSSTGFDLILEGADYCIHQVSYVNQDGVDCTNEIHSGAMFAEYAVNSMNQHDKLTEENKMLRKALQLVRDIIPMHQNTNNTHSAIGKGRGLNKYARGYLVSIDQDGFGYISLEKQGDVFPEITIGEAVKRLNSLSNSHDKLVEQKGLLQEALSLVINKIPMNQNIYGGGYMLLLSKDDCHIIKETLNISELN